VGVLQAGANEMQNSEKLTPEQISEFLKGSAEISLTTGCKVKVYGWVQDLLVAREFASQSKKRIGSIRACVEKSNGAQRDTDNTTHPAIPRDRSGRVAARVSAALSEEKHGWGHHASGRGGPGPRMAERACHAMYATAGVRTIRQRAVRAAAGDFERASV
jgi:hypothetical protein